MKFLMSLGLLIFAMNGAEFVAPYVTEMKDGPRNFPKAMYMLACPLKSHAKETTVEFATSTK